MDGIIIIDKPEEKSSAFIDCICKKILNIKKIGHIGTLDPFATGVLAIAINGGTKAIHYIQNKKKKYLFQICFGEKKDTGDKTGTTIESSNVIPNENDIINIIPFFTGIITQKPSHFSAIKINGKRAYDLARKGIFPDMPERKVEIFELKLNKQISENIFEMEAIVSSGTYIRTLCEDIGLKLQTFAYALSLRRLSDGIFDIKNAIPLDELEKKKYDIESVMFSFEDVLDDIPVIFISIKNAEDLRCGRKFALEQPFENREYLAKSEDGYLGIVTLQDNVMIPKRMLQNFSKGE